MNCNLGLLITADACPRSGAWATRRDWPLILRIDANLSMSLPADFTDLTPHPVAATPAIVPRPPTMAGATADSNQRIDQRLTELNTLLERLEQPGSKGAAEGDAGSAVENYLVQARLGHGRQLVFGPALQTHADGQPFVAQWRSAARHGPPR